ncbi:uncharacterized mitochondrial protein-like protein, partial [Tanacetum coccineum]
GLTCLIANATIDESNLWHKRLGHINFKTMNKLVRGNLVRSLPSKLFENDHSCVACQKGNQHKASLLAILENTSIFDGAYDDEDVGEEANLNNLETTMNKDNGIFISQDKYVADILKKFDFVTVKTSSTPIKTNKALLKDKEAEDVDVYLYRSMIGSLMYLTASRPDKMFVVYACAMFQVTSKVSHLQVVKRIFRYLKGPPKLGLWYPRDLPFDLEAFSDSDYARASLDRKSTIGDSYEKKLIQVIKIHTDHNVADLLTKAFDVSWKAKRTTKISQSSGSIHLVVDETVYKEWEDIMEMAATTASSLEVKQDSGNINRTQSMATVNESFPQGTDLGSC